MFKSTHLNIPQTPSSEDIWEEFQNAYKNFVMGVGAEPTHVIIPCDKYSALAVSSAMMLRASQTADKNGRIIKINNFTIVESAQGGDIIFGYLSGKE